MRKIYFSYCLIMLFIGSSAFGQTNEVTSTKISAPFQSGNATSIDINVSTSLKKKIHSAVFKVNLNFGEEYLRIEGVAASFSFSLQALDNGSPVPLFEESIYNLAISEDTPENVFIKDISSAIMEVEGNQNFTFDQINLTLIDVPTGLSTEVLEKIDITLEKNIVYGVDITQISPLTSASFEPVKQEGKTITIEWSDDYEVDKYELQVLKLFNIDGQKVASGLDTEITANLQWEQALRMEINIPGKYIVDGETNEVRTASFTMGEGTGYYVFRLRPITSFFEGGVTNSKNWGPWSEYETGIKEGITKNNLSVPYFYFTDPDEDKNWIYNRVFTEQSKVKENLTFANGLQQVKQSQTYLPSKDVTLVSQTVSDYSGRPSLVSIPVPLGGRIDSYQENFMKAAGGELYAAKHFDDQRDDENSVAANYNNPATVDMDNPGFQHFLGLNDTVPSAEGFPFVRTIYYNDGTNRVKEQSGVGKTHMVAPVQAENAGRTTRYFYATPSESELIALFGDEAPSSESVVKSITVDPNNTASVTYTSKEGNVIATSLSFWEDTDHKLLNVDETAEINGSGGVITDKITGNSRTAEGFISAKRINILQTTDLNITYSITQAQLMSLCNTTTINCKYYLEIVTHKLDDVGGIAATQVVYQKQLDFSGLTTINLPLEGEEIRPTLEPATYIIEKRLRVGTPEASVADNAAQIGLQVNPITNLLAGWLDQVHTEKDMEYFVESLKNLSDAMFYKRLDEFTNNELQYPEFPDKFVASFNVDFIAMYNDVDEDGGYMKDKYSLTLTFGSTADVVSLVTLTTPCCTSMEIPVDWVPPYKCDANEDGTIALAEIDFMGYMMDMMYGCYGPGTDYADGPALQTFIEDEYMWGWETQVLSATKKVQPFNLMVYHMLTDEYSTEQNGEGGPRVQYTCDELLSCWTNQVMRLKDEICQNTYQFGAGTPPFKVSDEYDDQYSNDTRDDKYEKGHDAHFDDSFKGGFFLTKWIAKRKISKRMRNLQGNDGAEGEIKPDLEQFHLVKDFLECTGYKFSVILTPTAATPPQDSKPGYDYKVDITETANAADYAPIPFEMQSINSDVYYDGTNSFEHGTGDYYYGRIADFDPKGSDGKSMFPYITNPIYAFKYFEYTPSYYIDQEGNLKSHYQSLEYQVCYTDPNDCYQLDLDGFYVLDEFDQPIKVACCAANPSTEVISNKCFPDPEYPGLATMTVGIDPGVETYNGQKVKFVVKEFCETGRVRCPYTQESWSSGQRFTFYSLLRTYIVPEAADWQDLAPLERSCEDLSEDHTWWSSNVDGDHPEFVNDTELATYNSSLYTQYYLPVNGEQRATFSYIEMEMVKQLADCNSGCDRRKSEFRSRLLKMLQERCYIIGGCRTDDPSTFNIIPEEDIDVMVASLVEACKSQCTLTTYTCEDTPCRQVNVANIVRGVTVQETKQQYGIGGYPTSPEYCETPDVPLPNYEDGTACTNAFMADLDGDGIEEQVKHCDIGGFLSWYEFTKMQQATTWDFDLEMPMMCEDANGPVVVAGDMACCDDMEVNSTKGETFVPKDQYEINPNIPFDANNPKLNEPVKSPSIGINVTVEGE